MQSNMSDITINCRKIVEGKVEGKAIITSNPINFLAMVNLNTGEITDKSHDLFDFSLRDKILVFPNSIGSSVGAYSIYALKMNKTNPKGIICTNKADIITASGCAIANIPVVDRLEKNLINLIENETELILDSTNQKITIKNSK